MPIDFQTTIRADLWRCYVLDGRSGFWRAFREMPGLRFSYFLRKCPVARHRPRWLRIASTLPYSILLNRYRFRHGLEISVESEIEPELYISHFGRLVVRPKCILGSNVNLSSGVVIGQTNRGRKQGVPVIGNYV